MYSHLAAARVEMLSVATANSWLIVPLNVSLILKVIQAHLECSHVQFYGDKVECPKPT